MSIPEPCIDCGKPSLTKRGDPLCRGCLRKRIREDNPEPKVFNDQRGRSCRSTASLGGSSDMRTTDELE